MAKTETRGGPRANSGGKREGAGRKPLVLNDEVRRSMLDNVKKVAKAMGTSWEEVFAHCVVGAPCKPCEKTGVREGHVCEACHGRGSLMHPQQPKYFDMYLRTIMVPEQHITAEIEDKTTAPVLLPLLSDDPSKMDFDKEPEEQVDVKH